jgi:serine/threonine protein kinase
MNPERWRRIEELYWVALEMEPEHRAAFLAEPCLGDDDLRSEVESLLAHSAPTEDLVDHSAWAAAEEVGSSHEILKPGELLGRYQILGLLGTGGMAVVYSALDGRLDRKVAIKVCQERFSGRFEREATTISALNHPNICTLHDVGPNYLVMELVAGETLRDWIKTPSARNRSLEIARQVLEALRAAHAAGIVHRDLKPKNIMVRFDGYVKVLDFGIAKRISEPIATNSPENTKTGVTVPGQIVGTIAYMSPEQVLGKEVDLRCDLFAFGVILYEMLSGRHPWPHTSAVDILHAIVHDEPAPIEALPPALASIVERLLRKHPADRFPSAESVLHALANSTADLQITTLVGQSAEPLTSIAVLPFLLLNEVEDRKAFSLGFADALITTLSSFEDIRVLPTSAVMNYVPGTDAARTCQDLGVRHTLQGSVQRQGAHWRVSTQLFDGKTQKLAFAEKHDFVREDVFEVQDEIGRLVVESLQIRFKRAAPKSRNRYSSDPEAYDEFMLGLAESYSDREETLRSSAQHLLRAVERDPDFALAHAVLSYVAMHIHWEFDPDRAWLIKAERHCHSALTLDPALPEAHSARAFILFSPAKNFQCAEAIVALERVLAAQPNNERAHNRMASICIHIGRFEEALKAHHLARRSNPKTRANNLEFVFLWSGDFARAEEAGEAWIREKPGGKYAIWFHPLPALMGGDLDTAEHRLAAGLKLYPDEPLLVSMQGMLHARRGETSLALDCVRRSQESPHSFGHTHHTYYQVACVYAVLGEREKAMGWLERSAYNGNPCWPFFKVDPYLDNLRPEPRFQKLVADLEIEYTALKIERV